MERAPAPPASLARPHDHELVAAEEAVLWRVFRAAGRHPQQWDGWRLYGPVGRARFDPHPDPPQERPGYGVCYLAADFEGRHGPDAVAAALAEAFQPPEPPPGKPQPPGVIDRHAAEPWLAALRITERMRLLDLSSHWTVRAGGNQAITSGPRRDARAWARAIFSQLPDIDGLAYRPSTGGPCTAVALWQRHRSRPRLPAQCLFARALADPAIKDLVYGLAGRLGYLVV